MQNRYKAVLLCMVLCSELSWASPWNNVMRRIVNVMHVREIKVGRTYQHYSGKLYKVVAVAYDSENPELQRVVYQGLYDDPKFGKNPVWDRPYEMFAEQVVIDGVQRYRFTEIETKIV